MATNISAKMVNELRRLTSAGIMECKKALVEAEGDLAKAEDIIKKSGHRKAEKKAGRTAAEGRVVVAKSPAGAVVIEINSETDFVGKEQSFVDFTQKLADNALANDINDLPSLLDMPFDPYENVEKARQAIVAKIGENIQIRRYRHLSTGAGEQVGCYVHHGRIGGVVLISGGDEALAKDLAMQVVANKPQFIEPENVPQEVIDKEKEILTERAKNSGKPAEMLDKIVSGQLKKHFNEICLVGQPFFKDPDITVGSLLKKHQATVLNMVRLEVGEGIEVEKKSFEEEVLSAAKGSQ